jgi:hypothetical protein
MPAPTSAWSAPAVAGTGAAGEPLAVFSSAGVGTIAWTAGAGGSRVLTLAPDGARAAASGPPRAVPLGSVAGATADTRGRVALAGALGPGTAGATALLEADPAGSFGAPRALNRGGGPVALTNYLSGEVAMAAGSPLGRIGRILLRLQPPHRDRLGAPVELSALTGPVTAISVGLDYRGDAIVAWQQQGRIWARVRHLSGTLGPREVVGASAPAPLLDAVVSDDQRGMVAWTDETPAGSGETAATHLSISGLGVHFGRAALVQSWAERAGVRLAAGAMRLRRLANGRVMLGWTGRQGGRAVVQVAPVSLSGLRPAAVVSEAGTAAQLRDLVPGPDGEVLAVMTSDGELETAVGVDQGVAGQAVFSPVEPVAAVPAATTATATFDPLDDRPVVVWRSGGDVRFSLRAAPGLP